MWEGQSTRVPPPCRRVPLATVLAGEPENGQDDALRTTKKEHLRRLSNGRHECNPRGLTLLLLLYLESRTFLNSGKSLGLDPDSLREVTELSSLTTPLRRWCTTQDRPSSPTTSYRRRGVEGRRG